MRFLVLVLIFHGAPMFVHGMNCILETLRCSNYRVAMKPNKNLMETPEAFNDMCKQQERYYGCLEDVARSQDDLLPPPLLKAKILTEELCSEQSAWRRSYLEMAHCINAQHTGFCTSMDFLSAAMHFDAVPQSLDDLRDISHNCIAAVLSINCDIEAGNVFNYLLRISLVSYEDCGSESEAASSCHGGLKENYRNLSKLNDIYSGLLRKIGDIPNQNADHMFAVVDRLGDSRESGVDEMASEVSEDYSDLKPSHMRNANDIFTTEGADIVKNMHFLNSEQVSDPESENYAETESIHSLNLHGVSSESTIVEDNVSVTENVDNAYTKDDVEAFYHPDGRVSVYMRESDSFSIDSIKCELIAMGVSDVVNTFHCRITRRDKNPKCLDSSITSTKGKIIPEEIDPEFGIELYETYPKIPYHLQEFLGEDSETVTEQYQSTSHSGDKFELGVEMDYLKDVNVRFGTKSNLERDLSGESLLLHDPNRSGDFDESKESATLYTTKDEDLEFVTELPRNYETTEDNSLHTETLDKLVEVFTIASQAKTKSIYAETVQDQIRLGITHLFTLEDNARIPEMIHSPDGSINVYWPIKEPHVISSIICGRVNECHPKARNIFKCVIVPGQEPCATCSYAQQTHEIYSDDHSVNRETADELTTVDIVPTGYRAVMDGSDVSEYSETSQSAAVYLADETEFSILEPINILNSALSHVEVDQTNEQAESELSPYDFKLLIPEKDSESSDPVYEQDIYEDSVISVQTYVPRDPQVEDEDSSEESKYPMDYITEAKAYAELPYGFKDQSTEANASDTPYATSEPQFRATRPEDLENESYFEGLVNIDSTVDTQ